MGSLSVEEFCLFIWASPASLLEREKKNILRSPTHHVALIWILRALYYEYFCQWCCLNAYKEAYP